MMIKHSKKRFIFGGVVRKLIYFFKIDMVECSEFMETVSESEKQRSVVYDVIDIKPVKLSRIGPCPHESNYSSC